MYMYKFHRYTGTQPMTQTVWRRNGRRSPPLVLGNQTVGRPSFLGTITWVTGSEVSLWSTTGQCPTLCMRTVSWESGGWLTCVMFFHCMQISFALIYLHLFDIDAWESIFTYPVFGNPWEWVLAFDSIRANICLFTYRNTCYDLVV